MSEDNNFNLEQYCLDYLIKTINKVEIETEVNISLIKFNDTLNNGFIRMVKTYYRCYYQVI